VQVILIEDDPKKVMHLMLPPGLLLRPGTRMVIDNGQPDSGPFKVCYPNMCLAQYEISSDYVQRMKRGQQIVVSAMSGNGQMVSVPIPLEGFAKAHDGPATDPKVAEEQQKKLQAELQRRAEEQRNKIQPQPGGAPQQSAR
jgi:invasion protein IalB